MRLWREWREERARRRKAESFAASMHAEPSDAAVRWLAEHGTNGDVDHARWELRYARRALGLLVARRDALDDRTPSLIATVVMERLAQDPGIDPPKRVVAERQFNIRLRAYREAMERRERPVPTAERLAEVLFSFAGKVALAGEERVRAAGEILAGYLAEAHESLRREFGDPSLPDDVLPSTLQAGGSSTRAS